MKTEKKANDPALVKEEPDPDRVKIKEETQVGQPTEDAIQEDPGAQDCAPNPAPLDSVDEPAQNIPQDQNGPGQNPQIKQEQERNQPLEDIPTSDCGSNVGMQNREGIQPLVSNVLAKQMGTGSGGGEAQYMQQQSQIFVFSTSLANKAAEAVMQGQFSSIIAFHCAQPGTKMHLEKHPNKVNQFRQNPAQWLNNLANLKQKSHQGNVNSGFPAEQTSDLPALDAGAPFWNEQSNIRNLNGNNSLGNSESTLDNTNIDVPCLVPNSPNNAGGNPQSSVNATMGQSPNLLGGPISPNQSGLQPTLQGVKVPDEELTPQQRQHREAQLAALRKMQILLFPEHKEDSIPPLDTQQGANPGSSCPPSNMPPVSAPSMDWHKIQNPFMDGKNKLGAGSPGGTTPTGNNPLRGGNLVGNVPRSQGPPPPYHQTTRSASVPIAIQSPNPSSPNNPTSNLSLPSPRASSALNSPADCNRQFQLSNQRPGHLSGQSPTSQDSPNPGTVTASSATRLNQSNPGTPVSHAHLPVMSPGGSTPQKDSPLDFPSNQPPNLSVDGRFCRTMPCLTQQKQQHGGAVNPPGVKEANLMPVPSPQQIQYLNTFEGQELTIQKQPNTGLKDGNLSTNTNTPGSEMPNRIMPNAMEGNNQFEGASPSMENANRSFGASLHSPHTPHTPHTPSSGQPHTPVDPSKAGSKTTLSAQSSPASHNTNLVDSMGPPRTVPASPNTKLETSPPSKDHSQQNQQQQMSQQQPVQVPQQSQQQMAPQQNQPGPMPVMNPNQGMGPGMVGPGPNFRPNVSQSDNVPLNPNNIGNRMPNISNISSNHFDPITSLAQMSQQLTNTAASNALGPDGGPMPGGNGGNMLPFGNHPHGMHMMQMQGGNEMNGGCHMPGGPNESSDVAAMCMGLSGPATSYSPTPHTGSPGVPNKMGHHHGMMSHGMMGNAQPGNNPSGPGGPGGGHMNANAGVQGGSYPGGGGVSEPPNHSGPGGPNVPPGNRLMSGGIPPHPHQHPHPGHGPMSMGGNPYNGANVQVKPSAPNTIQYLPARPNVGHAPRGPPSLDFLQRFTNPLSGLDSKMAPSVNLQYFPNGCVPQNNMNPSGGGPGPGGLQNMVGNLPPGMAGSPSGQQMNPGVHPSMRPMGNVRQQSSIVRMQHMVGGGMFPSGSMEADMVGGPQMPGQSPNQGMFVGNKQGLMGLGPPPEASQPLPPSMGGGATNFKNSPFVGAGPNMSDPNYAQQFHNFQQQLYATGTRGSGPPGPPPHPNLHQQPNSHGHQQFFMPK